MINITHVWSGSGTDARVQRAQDTWSSQRTYGGWTTLDLSKVDLGRNALSVGETVPLPFIHDMIDKGFEKPETDAVVITNDDTGMGIAFASDARVHLAARGAFFCHRWNFPANMVPMGGKNEIEKGKWYVGADAFGVTRKWWSDHKAELPPFILGRETWDWIFRELIKETGGAEMDRSIWHQQHDAPWKRGRRNQPGNVYNRSYARAWLKHRNMSLREIANAPYNEVSWPPVKWVEKPKFTPAASGTDVLIVMGRGSKWNNMELRYCLRSLEKHAKNMGKIWVVGTIPDFLSQEVGVLPHSDFGRNKEHNLAEQVQFACGKLPISEEFLWVNDDMFLLADTDISTYPYYAGGALKRKWTATQQGGYRVSLMQTEAQLMGKNLPTHNFEIHVPIRYNKVKFLSLHPWIDLSSRCPMGLTFRSIYCNALGIQPTQLADMKLDSEKTKAELVAKIGTRHILSIGDGLGDDAKTFFSDMFPNKSKYENA